MANFALFGAAGYIAPRHLEAIKDLGHNLVAAHDISDSVGVLDRYFPQCAFFTDFAKFEQHMQGQKLDYVSICSPNHVHSSQIRWALEHGADALCEKPLVLTVRELDELIALEKKTGHRAYTVLQLRLHSAIRELREKVRRENSANYKVNLSYITSRGPWYLQSWKGDIAKSGGLCTNIGIHLFDMLIWIFGTPLQIRVDERSPISERGFLKLERAEVQWDLSIDRSRLPQATLQAGKTTFRSINIDGSEFEFSDGFTELHKTVYRDILEGRGYGIEDARPAIAIAERIRGL